jgi:CubicO group peptidase (beta-lactamase class C family)
MADAMTTPTTRRSFLARVAATSLSAAVAPSAATPSANERPVSREGPVFERGGPNAQLYGEADGYPVPPRPLAVSEGNPWSPRYRVGAFSHLDAIYATRSIRPAVAPWQFKRVDVDLTYRFRGQQASLADYLSRRPVTGLVIARDDSILFEHYQYGRTDADRMLGQSMTKSLTGVLLGIAIADGAIRTIDDTPEMYVPGFKGSEYGRTPIRDLLHTSSGVEFGEERDGGRDLNRLWIDMVLGSGITKKGTLNSIKQFNRRVAPSGTKFHYASIEADVIGLLLHHVLGRPLSAYTQEKLWQPMGAEADATWLVDTEGVEVAHFGFSAVLRDYARLARLLACEGAWEGRQIIPADWVIAATTVQSPNDYLAPGRATRLLGYGYLLWLLAGKKAAVRARWSEWAAHLC